MGKIMEYRTASRKLTVRLSDLNYERLELASMVYGVSINRIINKCLEDSDFGLIDCLVEQMEFDIANLKGE